MTKLPRADDPLLLALACGLSAEQAAEEAARQAGVSVKTAYRRLGDAAFAARLGDLRRDLLARAAAMLTAAAVESVRTLADLLKPANAPATRLNAARATLEHGVKLRALVAVEASPKDLDDRLAQLTPAEARRGRDGGYS